MTKPPRGKVGTDAHVSPSGCTGQPPPGLWREVLTLADDRIPQFLATRTLLLTGAAFLAAA